MTTMIKKLQKGLNLISDIFKNEEFQIFPNSEDPNELVITKAIDSADEHYRDKKIKEFKNKIKDSKEEFQKIDFIYFDGENECNEDEYFIGFTFNFEF